MDDAWVDGHVAFLFSAADVGVAQFGGEDQNLGREGRAGIA
jgi:hypothetical protein